MIRVSTSKAGAGKFRRYQDTDNAGLTEAYVVLYSLIVNNGTGDGGYEENDTPSIVADSPSEGYVFDQWTGDTAYVDNVNNASTFVTMPADDVEVTAAYRLIDEGDGFSENMEEYDGEYQ